MSFDASDNKGEKWVVLEVELDGSYCLVRESNLICDLETFELGNKVSFIYSGKEWTGLVREVGGKSHYLC